MTSAIAAITVDSTDALAAATFWSAVLDRPLDPDRPAHEHFAALRGDDATPTMMFIGVPEPRTVKNRVHLDLITSDREAEVERLVGLGATRLADHDEWGHVWTTLADPAGNEFCVAARRARVTPGA